MCYDKYAHSCFKGGIVGWNWMMFLFVRESRKLSQFS